MKKQSQAGFIPLIVALIAALSLGGGVWAYKAEKHKKEVKIEEQARARGEGQSLGEGKTSADKEGTNPLSMEGKGSLRVKEAGDDDSRDTGDWDDEDDDDDNGGVRTPPPVVVTPPKTGGTIAAFTLADVKLHNTRTNCWTAVNGSVYNVTNWITQHPGGASAIVGMCGIDASGAFNGQHGGQARPVSELASFKIGILK